MDESGFRLDIQGLRGLALVIVLTTHAGWSFAEGGFVGLDVFYVLSGYLITGLILHEIDRTGTVSLLRFYARRARRLLPAAATVLAAVFVGSLLLLGGQQSYKTAGDMLAAALYFSNWRFMAQETDYFAVDAEQSPVQHYWSLSVEEQFYFLWPVVVLGALYVARRSGWSRRAILGAVVGVLGLASLAYGVWFSGVDPEKAYFSTLTRLWQIALGCGLALVLPAGIRLARHWSALLTGGSIAVLLATTVLYSGETRYPGWAALFPTVAAALVIVAGTSTTTSVPVRLLCTAPMQYLGRISYVWYLWHWPALIFAEAWAGQALSAPEKTLVTLASWAPAILTHHLIEERFRRSRTLARRPRLAMSFGAACTAAAAVLAVALTTVRDTVPTASAEQAVGAEAVEARGERLQASARALRPDPRKAEEDRGDAFTDRCHLKGSRRVASPDCVYGDAEGKRTVVNLGDSHGLMYAPAAIKLAERKGWRLVSLTRAGCVVADVELDPECDAWRENSMQRIESDGPDLVLVSAGTDDGERYGVRRDGERLDRDASQPHLEHGFERTLRRLKATGAEVVVIRDMSRAPDDVLDCVTDNPKDLERCAFAPNRREDRAFDARAARRAGVTLLDPAQVLCPRQRDGDRRCPAVIGNVVVYRNAYHLTATFARTLAPWLERRLPEVGAR